MNSQPEAQTPLVSVILTTRDRPHLLPVALACYEHQAYPNRELIVVDDGDVFPVDPAALDPYGARLIRVDPGTPLGIKLNRGAGAARGLLCMKMDDDDWYGPAYLQTMMTKLQESQRVTCQPTVAFLMGFLFFELGSWELRESVGFNIPGATFLFSRDDWQAHPFRPISTDEDYWFLTDQIEAGGVGLPVEGKETYIAIRHQGHKATRGHTWTHQLNGQTLEEYLKVRPIYSKAPEELLPPWAIEVYRRIHADLAQAAESAAAT
jgi:hypothetical protein